MPNLGHLARDSHIFSQLMHFPCAEIISLIFLRAATHNVYARFLQEFDNKLHDGVFRVLHKSKFSFNSAVRLVDRSLTLN